MTFWEQFVVVNHRYYVVSCAVSAAFVRMIASRDNWDVAGLGCSIGGSEWPGAVRRFMATIVADAYETTVGAVLGAVA